MRPLLAKLFRLVYGRKMQALAGVPGPTPLFPLGTLLELRGEAPWDACAAYEKTYGGLTLIWIGGKPMLVLNDPELIREVLITRRGEFYKDNPAKAFRPVLKETEFDENGPEWRRLRDLEPLSMKGFDAWLPTQVAVVRNTVEGHLQRLTAAPGPVDLLPAAERLCYDVFNACAVGRQLGDQEYRAFYTTSNMATERMQLPDWLLLPPLRPSFYAARRRHFGAFEAIVREARAKPDPAANDMLHVYLRHKPEITDEQLATFLGNIHAGGVFSTGTALVNTLYLLNLHPQVMDELTAQVRALVRDRPDFDAAALAGCPLVDQVLLESLRYYAPVPLFFRNVRKDKPARLANRVLPPDTVLAVVVRGVHRSAKYWKDPDRFDPSRWAPGAAAAGLESDTFFPFGRGPRACVGAGMAMFCLRVMLTTLLSRSRVVIDPKTPYRQFFHCGVGEPKHIMGRFVPHQ
jgi:cytochrome P450